jgi:hypothetical protein
MIVGPLRTISPASLCATSFPCASTSLASNVGNKRPMDPIFALAISKGNTCVAGDVSVRPAPEQIGSSVLAVAPCVSLDDWREGRTPTGSLGNHKLPSTDRFLHPLHRPHRNFTSHRRSPTQEPTKRSQVVFLYRSFWELGEEIDDGRDDE